MLGSHLNSMACVLTLCLSSNSALALEPGNVALEAGVKMGFAWGQNGGSWPRPWTDPFKNENRAGFYAEQLRLGAVVPLDSGFRVAAKYNIIWNDLTHLYVEKLWGAYWITFGKFQGAGLRTGSGTDEFSSWTIRRPVYARVRTLDAKTFGWSDFGGQVERRHAGGVFVHRFVARNASHQNVINDDPSYRQSDPTHVLGFDYGWEWKVTESGLVGGHLGVRADREWQDFFGTHEAWEPAYWFKTNAFADASLFHEFSVGRAWFQNEAYLASNRQRRNPVDSSFTKTWGVSLFARFQWTESLAPFGRYEFYDRTDGLVSDDAWHLFTAGLRWRPSPGSKFPWFWTIQASRNLEEGLRNRESNDAVFAQLQIQI